MTQEITSCVSITELNGLLRNTLGVATFSYLINARTMANSYGLSES